ncbi:hypothetical protein [Pseudonocardia sp. TRM90224]|uniref:hypothetical protein n=1 Tax=Pseudonocardia sp. TRM90224 TaxID=2812678 RepID=UPI001E34C754|nr:hypothetical protein [Pseudonocardia sp. TRM90224]
MDGSAADDALLAELAEVLRPQLVPPPELVEAAKQSYTWRTVDAELARLTHDSLIDDGPVLARSSGQPRILTFEVSAVVIEVEVDTTPSGRRLLGQLVPAVEMELEVHVGEVGQDETVTATGRSDALGRFVLPLPKQRGLVRLRCTLPDGAAVETARIRL